MFRNSLLVLGLGLFILGGCAKKQAIRPSPDEMKSSAAAAAAQKAQETKKEPSIRFTDWSAVPDLEMVNFELDKSTLDETARNILKKNAEYLKANVQVNILVEGNCDERGTTEYNLALGQRRATAVRNYYSMLGISKGRIATLSYGEEKPLNPENSESAWAINRRAETKIRDAKNK